MENKRGEILVGTVVFILLNLVFLSILILFLVKQGSGAVIFEQSYAKQTALLIDSSKPSMIIRIDMEKGKNIAEKNGINFEDILKIEGNVVRVKLSEKGGYTYSFFNDVEAVPYPDSKEENMYVITISEK